MNLMREVKKMSKFDWVPMNNVIVVETEKVEERSKGGIILTDSLKEREQYGKDSGVLIAMGETAFQGMATKPKIGDEVMFDKYDGKARDKGELRILVDEDILAIKSKEEANG